MGHTRFWTQSTTFIASYVNNRNQNTFWQYDAAGHLTRDDDIQYTWDAAGRNRQALSLDGTRTNNQWHDGDGRIAKREELRTDSFPHNTTTYFVRSTVMGGRIITELNPQGQKQKGYVYAWGEVLAEQAGNVVTWRHNNPVTGSRGESSANGAFWISLEPDPAGVNVGVEDPFIDPFPIGFEPMPELPMLFPFGGDGGCSFSNPNCTRCSLDGFEIGCEQAFHLMDIGAAVPCPNNDCGPRVVNGRLVPFDPSIVTVTSYGVGLFSVTYNWGQDLGIIGQVYDEEAGEMVDVYGSNSNTRTNFFVLPGLGNGQTQTTTPPGIDHAKILKDSIDRVKKRLTGECLKLFDKIDPSNYLANYVSIGEQTYRGNAFAGEMQFAATASDADAKGKTLPSGHTVFNKNSTFFSGTLGGKPFPGTLLKKESSTYGLSLDEIRDLAVLHEMYHINDVDEKYDDNTSDAQKNLENSKALNKLLREKCGFPVNK